MEEEQPKKSLGFAIAIKPNYGPDGKTIVGYQVQSQSSGLTDEVVITIISNWLKAAKENYYKKFTGQQQPSQEKK